MIFFVCADPFSALSSRLTEVRLRIKRGCLCKKQIAQKGNQIRKRLLFELKGGIKKERSSDFGRTRGISEALELCLSYFSSGEETVALEDGACSTFLLSLSEEFLSEVLLSFV